MQVRSNASKVAARAREPRVDAAPRAASVAPRDASGLLALQGTAGNRAVESLIRAALDVPSPPANGVAVQRRPRDQRHERASQLGAGDARALVAGRLPFVAERLTPKQLAQAQRVLDAAVLNPAVEAESNKIRANAVRASSGALELRDERVDRKADQALEQRINAPESDRHIRLDAMALVADDAFQPRTDNPDELAYLSRVRNTLKGRGVYLRLAPRLVRDPEDPSRHVLDPRSFEAWLSLGPDGDTIPTEDGQLTRDVLLKTTILGAGFYEHVDRGPAQRTFEQSVAKLGAEIEAGFEEHARLAKVRRETTFGVVEVSDVLGGADFPDMSIWDQPHKLLVRARSFNTGGNLAGAKVFLVATAISTAHAAQTLATYVDDTTRGASRAVTALKVAKTAGEIAGICLAVTGVPGLVSAGGRILGGEAAAGLAAAETEGLELANAYTAESGIAAEELKAVEWVKQPPGSTGGFVKGKHSAGAGQGFHKLF